MKCPKCGNELTRSQQNPEYGLCYDCKIKVKWVEGNTCKNCGAVHKGNFCPKCGTPRTAQNTFTEEVATPKEPTPVYTPAPVVAPEPQPQYNSPNPSPVEETSYFDGGLLELIGRILVGALLTAVTCGLCYPWACCMIYEWEISHTVINGHRLRFTGTASQLFGLWIKWWLLCLVTCGIYSFWVGIDLQKWKTKHTEFAD